MFGKQLFQCINSFHRLAINSHDVTGLGISLLRRACQLATTAPQSRPYSGGGSTVLPFGQCRQLSTTNALTDLPPDHDRPYVDYHVPRIRIRRARKTRRPAIQPHEFVEEQRSWNLRDIPSEEEAKQQHDLLAPDVVSKVNTQLEEGRAGRLFAVVWVMGRQYLVKTEDLITIRGHWAPKLGEVIRLEKVLAMGGRDFTLLGRPLLPRDQVFVEATVVEKTLTHTKIWFITKPRRSVRIWNFIREELTYLRINSVCVLNKVNELPDVRGVEGKVFGSLDS